MTLLVTVFVTEGIVMASDSRLSFNQTQLVNNADGTPSKQINNVGIHYSDTSYKTFVTKKGVGISSCGDAAINGSPIAGYIDTFVRENADTSVQDIPQKLLDYFRALNPNLSSEFHVAGYQENEGKLEQKIYRVFTSPHFEPDKRVEIVNTQDSGAMWNGQVDVLSKLINPSYFKRSDVNGNDIYVPNQHYGILWQYFTLQDAIDFAESAIKMTIDCIRFQQRSKNVGGPIDILVIKPDESEWLIQKKLHASG